MIVRVLIGVAVILVGVLVVWRMNTSGDAPSISADEVVQEAAQIPVASSRPVELQKLVGRWVRMDTPYVIEIRKVSEDDTLEAGYYNPRSINVSTAKVENKNGTLEVFVELRDRGPAGNLIAFAVDERDYQAKRAFSFLMFLFTLAETGEPERAPVLTIFTGQRNAKLSGYKSSAWILESGLDVE